MGTRTISFALEACDCGGDCCSPSPELAQAARSGPHITPEAISRYGTLTAALAQGMTADGIAEGEPDPTLPERWHAVACVEGIRTGDHRAIRPEGLSFRQLPIMFAAQFHNAGHYDAPIVGSVETLERIAWDDVPGANLIMASGPFDLRLSDGRQAAGMVRDQTLRWVSVDLEVFASEVMGTPPWEDDYYSGRGITAGADDWWEEITDGRIAGLTAVPIPAFQTAVLARDGADLDVPLPENAPVTVDPGLIASAVSEPPPEWFSDPALSEPTPLTVTDDGRVFGHIAQWGTCHTGLLRNGCTQPPRSTLNYEPFHSGGFVRLSDGATVRIGHLTMDGGHADLPLDARATRRHYDDSTTVWANVRAGEDDHGVWVAGAVAPGVTPEQVACARSLAISGDWRAWPGAGLELIAALSVPVPGFPVGLAASGAGVTELRPRARLVADEVTSLVAAGVVAPARPDELSRAQVRRIVEDATADLRASLAILDPLVVEAMAAEIEQGTCVGCAKAGKVNGAGRCSACQERVKA